MWSHLNWSQRTLVNQPPGRGTFIISSICVSAGERRDRLLFGKLILRDSSILNPLRDTLVLWLVWLLERKLTKEINNNTRVFVTAGGDEFTGDNLTGSAEKPGSSASLEVWSVRSMSLLTFIDLFLKYAAFNKPTRALSKMWSSSDGSWKNKHCYSAACCTENGWNRSQGEKDWRHTVVVFSHSVKILMSTLSVGKFIDCNFSLNISKSQICLRMTP